MNIPNISNVLFSASIKIDPEFAEAKGEDYIDRLRTRAEELIQQEPFASQDTLEIEFTDVPHLKIIGPVKIGGVVGEWAEKINDKVDEAKEKGAEAAENAGLTEQLEKIPGGKLMGKLAKGRAVKWAIKKNPATKMYIKGAQVLTNAVDEEVAKATYNLVSDEPTETIVVEKSWLARTPEKWAEKALEDVAKELKNMDVK